MVVKCRYKYETVADSLRESVRNGECPTGRIPSEFDLMRRFKVGKITIYKALKLLVDEGVLKRVQGKGTFVNGIHGKSLTISGQVPVVMSHTGHYYSTLASHIRRYLYEADLFSIPVDYHFSSKESPTPFVNDHLSLLLNSSIQGVIYDGNSYHEYPFMNEYLHLRSVVVDCFDAPGDIPGSAVLIDFKKATSKAVDYLADKGKREIILITHFPGCFPINDSTHFARHPVNQMIAGYEQAMAAKGLSEFSEVIIRGEENVDDQLRGIITRPRKVEAIICDADINALKIIMSAFMLGINIPEELSVVGMYDTPWCEESPVKITSVGFHEDEIAKKAVEMIAADKWRRKTITIEPEIIARRSA